LVPKQIISSNYFYALKVRLVIAPHPPPPPSPLLAHAPPTRTPWRRRRRTRGCAQDLAAATSPSSSPLLRGRHRLARRRPGSIRARPCRAPPRFSLAEPRRRWPARLDRALTGRDRFEGAHIRCSSFALARVVVAS